MFIYPTSIYGFNEGNTEYKLSDEILEEFTDVKCYISEIDTNDTTELFYGIECDFDPHIGTFTISKEKKDIMKSLFHKVMEYKTNTEENNDNKDFIIPELGYYICLGGDIDYSKYEIYNINNEQVLVQGDENHKKEEYKYHYDSDSEDSQFINEGDIDSNVSTDDSSNFSD
jgi:hypothetical protein